MNDSVADKQLKDKAIDIKGKLYVQVSERILYFNQTYDNGAIQTELISKPEDQMVVVKATVYPDVNTPDRAFTGYSQAKWGDGYINKTSALENCETSAVGRALAMMGIGVIESIASVDEIQKAENQKPSFSKQINTPDDVEEVINTKYCDIHDVHMSKQWSEKKQKHYYAHKDEHGKVCFGRDS